MGPRGFHPNVPHEIMFQTLAKSNKEIQIYSSTKLGVPKWGIICGKGKCIIMFPKHN